jgi:sterol desaturase/sphingolipid hydroxylase (fatty acid hydroxylase superfamily)
MFPFHVYTVYAINIALVAWALILHSAAHFNWPGFLGWLLVAPRDHNNHHNFGKLNTNYAALFTIWDRICGTLNRKADPYWWASDVEYAEKQEQFAASNPTMGTLAKLARAWTNFAHGKVAALAPVEAPTPPGEKKESLRHRAQKKNSVSH